MYQTDRIKAGLKRLCAILFILLFALVVCDCSGDRPVISTDPSAGEIYLYGETHGVEAILEQELALWQGHYQKDGLRHLFVELPYYTAEYLNLYIQTEDEAILDALHADWEGTALYVPAVTDFYRAIRETCPETVFHGTDVGHQYHTTGARYLSWLEERGLQETEQYRLTEQAIEQGKKYYARNDHGYRENRMVENFIRAFDGLAGESIMGVYGTAHTAVNAMAQGSKTVPSMAGQLHDRYGEALHIEDLKEVTEPLRMDSIEVGGKTYQAAYLGRQELSEIFPNYLCREFWRLESAYADFEQHLKTGDVLPYDNYPVQVETGQVFVIDYTLKDGTVQRKFYRSDGLEWQGLSATEEIALK